MKSKDICVAKIFYFHFILGMTFDEISKELEINVSSVKSTLYRMLKNIRKYCFGGDNNEETIRNK